MQEYEADQIALILLAEAGIDPRTKLDHQERIVAEESAMLDGRENMPEYMITHPLVSKLLIGDSLLTNWAGEKSCQAASCSSSSGDSYL